MKLTIKDLQQRTFQIDIDESKTVEELKQKIEHEKGKEYGAASQRLIYAGKFLDNENPLAEYRIAEDKFLVLMITKNPTSQSSKCANSFVGAQSIGNGLTDAANSAEKLSSDSEAQIAATTPALEEPISGILDQQAVTNIIEMGYPREKVMQAMQASCNNADQAVEHLLNEIPAISLVDQQLDATPAFNQTIQRPVNPFEFLRNAPEFESLREIVRTDNVPLEQCYERIHQSNPQLFQLIMGNEQAFLDLLFEEPHAVSHTVAFSASEMQSINRLKEFGFVEAEIIEAYLACEKNEDLAADFLFHDRDQN